MKKADETGDTAFMTIPLFFQTGMRIGECLALTFNDFDWEQVGHKELQTTLNCYTYSTTRREEQVEKLQKSLVL